MKKIIVAAALLILLAPHSDCQTKTAGEDSHFIPESVLKDKIRGAWAGQIIGCTYGGPTEFRYVAPINSNTPIKWNEHAIKWYYDHAPGLYDDVYMDLTFVEVFDKEGLDAPVESFAKAFAYAGYPLWHANQAARNNIVHGIMPPESGHWRNNPHADDIDFQIEADYAGIMAPGMPNAASHFSDDIGHIMNYGDGWYGGVYVANMYALAFVSDDMDYVVREALKSIPRESRYYKCMHDVIEWHKTYPGDWEIAWALVNKYYGHDIGCPSGVHNAGFNIDAVINSAYILIGLLYGEKDFGRTIDISTRCGADSDCNPASSGGILGTMIGWEAIPDYWKNPIYEVADRNFKYTDISFEKACALSLDQAKKVTLKYGGKVDESGITVRKEEVRPVRYEQSFEGLWPMEKISVDKALNTELTVSFAGQGVVIGHRLNTPKGFKDKGYEALVEVTVDGKSAGTVALPVGENYYRQEIFFDYDLGKGDHKVDLKWINKTDNAVSIVVTFVLPYESRPKDIDKF